MNTKTLILTLLLIAGVVMQNCAPKQKKETAETLSVSIVPQKYFVDKLSGEQIQVNVMIPPGAGHATYSPTARQFQEMSDSKLYVSMGYLGYEQTWMDRLEELNPAMNWLSLSDDLELIRGVEEHGDHIHVGGVDPHIWMSPKVVLQFLPALKDAMIQNFPSLKDTIEKNYLHLKKEIEELDQYTHQVVSNLEQKQFLIFHPALTYLARDYGLNQISIEQDGKEPSPAFLASVIQMAKKENIPVIFIQEEYDIRNARLISEEAGIHLVQINPMAYDWLASMRSIVQQLDQYLSVIPQSNL
ncbi:MAG TPA: zinc ABC transporter substrate-binding protein [Marinilabiliaceae bacterium]|nr:zinc ABC transporter substrate-binding protein [Marinilabiliaceae bacterium]